MSQAAQVIATMETPATAPASPPVVAPPNADVPKETPAEAPKELPTKSFAIAARKERQLQRAREQLAAEREALKAERAAIESERQRFAKPASASKALEAHGFSYKDATEEQLNDGLPTPEQVARQALDQVEQLKREQQDAIKAANEQQVKDAEAAADQALKEFREELQEFTQSEQAKPYELVRLYNASDLVYDTMEAYFYKHKKTLSVDEAFGAVEKYLEKSAEKIVGAGKIKAKFSQGAPAPQVPPQGGKVPAQPSRTLSNSMTAQTTPRVVESTPGSVQDQAMARALAALG